MPIDAKKLQAINTVIGDLEKAYGKGTLMQMGKGPIHKIDVIPTGCFSLDYALGIGGLPRGRVIEIYGPESSGKTTLCLHAIAQAQKANGAAAFIDAEHALDLNYAKNLGVNSEELFVSQPDCGEQALDVCEKLVSTNAFDIIVIDSVAALVPRAEIEGEMGDSHMALQARLMSQALRKLTGLIAKSKTAVVFINQLRSKIGVMFGCFEGNSKVTMSDISQINISKMVKKQKEYEVFCYDLENKKVLKSKVNELYNNGKKESFWNLTFESVGGSGKQGFNCTPEHVIITPYGEIPAKKMKVGNTAYHLVTKYLSETQRQLIYGSLLGDGHINNTHGYTAEYREEHSIAQKDYLDWKRQLLSNIIKKDLKHIKNSNKECYNLSSPSLYEFYEIRQKFYNKKGKKILPDDFGLPGMPLTPLALAVWYMDDGTLNIKKEKRSNKDVYDCAIYSSSFTKSENMHLVNMLKHHYGIDCHYYKEFGGRIILGRPATRRLHEIISKYVIERMQYKLIPEQRGKYSAEFLQDVFVNEYQDVAPVKCIRSQPTRKSLRTKAGYDIAVNDAQNYFVSKILVHNSPETTTGGNALKFYASVRLDIRKIAVIKEGGQDSKVFIGNRTKVKVVKSKVSPPFKETEFDVLYGSGIDVYGDILDCAVSFGVVKKGGAWLTFGEDRIQGREKMKEVMMRDGIFFEEMKQQVVKVMQDNRLIKVNQIEETIEAPVVIESKE